MKKKSILNLIRYHAENNDPGFRAEAYEIAKEFDQAGDSQLASYIMAQLSSANTFIPQQVESDSPFLKKVSQPSDPLFLPIPITNDIRGIAHAVQHQIGVHRFLFQGDPGTGKTEAVKQLARILDRELFLVDFSFVIDSRYYSRNSTASLCPKKFSSFLTNLMPSRSTAPIRTTFVKWGERRRRS